MTNALHVGERVACAWGLGLICLMHTILRGNLFHCSVTVQNPPRNVFFSCLNLLQVCLMTNALQVGERVACAWGLGLICLVHTILRGNLFH